MEAKTMLVPFHPGKSIPLLHTYMHTYMYINQHPSDPFWPTARDTRDRREYFVNCSAGYLLWDLLMPCSYSPFAVYVYIYFTSYPSKAAFSSDTLEYSQDTYCVRQLRAATSCKSLPGPPDASTIPCQAPTQLTLGVARLHGPPKEARNHAASKATSRNLNSSALSRLLIA